MSKSDKRQWSLLETKVTHALQLTKAYDFDPSTSPSRPPAEQNVDGRGFNIYSYKDTFGEATAVMLQDHHGVPSFRAVAHVITNDPGIYYRDHFGCVAYFWDAMIKTDDKPQNLGDEAMPYVCCNSRIEDFDLVASRVALLRVLMFSSYSNLETFIRTVACQQHRHERLQYALLRSHWFQELAWALRHPDLSFEGNTLRLQPRWDAGMSDEDRTRCQALARHDVPAGHHHSRTVSGETTEAQKETTSQRTAPSTRGIASCGSRVDGNGVAAAVGCPKGTDVWTWRESSSREFDPTRAAIAVILIPFLVSMLISLFLEKHAGGSCVLLLIA